MTARQRLLHYFAKYKRSLFLGALCVVASSAFSLAKPLIVGNAVDELSRDLTQATLIRYALLLVGVAAIQGVFLYLQRWILIGASRHIEYDMRGDFYDHLQTLPPSVYGELRTGDLMSRATNDLSSVRMLIGPAVMHSFSSLLVVVGAFFMMFTIDRTLALSSLAAVPLVAGAVKFFGQRIHNKFKAVQDHFGEISARVQENLAGVRVVRAFAQEENELATFKRMNREYVDRNRRLIRLTATFYPLLHAFIGLLFVGIFYFGSRRILAGTMSIGEFVAFQFYLARMIWPLIALGWVINLFQRGMASMVRLTDIWNITAPNDWGGARGTPAGSSIVIRDLTFAYGERPVLKNLDLTVGEGETIGIVGRTGSGKSTLLTLLAGYHTPPPGTVFIGGVAFEEIPLASLRDMIAFVPQETFLFSDSVAENIRFGRASATDEDVEEVAALAGLSSDLESFPEGIRTIVGERGITLSGGQKQRTAIARAIVRVPQILLLDDALSAVDTATEERILKSLRDVRRGRTALVVSHRVSSVKDADQIIVLERGRIVERGTHDDLMERNGYYADLYRRQTLEEELEEIA